MLLTTSAIKAEGSAAFAAILAKTTSQHHQLRLLHHCSTALGPASDVTSTANAADSIEARHQSSVSSRKQRALARAARVARHAAEVQARKVSAKGQVSMDKSQFKDMYQSAEESVAAKRKITKRTAKAESGRKEIPTAEIDKLVESVVMTELGGKEQEEAGGNGLSRSSSKASTKTKGWWKSDDEGFTLSMDRTDRMVTQVRLIRKAIQDARERGPDNEEETFFQPFEERLPPENHLSREGIFMNLGDEPSTWGKKIPPVKDRWHEVLALGLTSEIVLGDRPAAHQLGNVEDMTQEEMEAFGDLVDDHDLEDHERLEQLGDSIVNMSSRLLAYKSYPDFNEGALTRVSNYPTQNNYLALLFHECGLHARRDTLRAELRAQYGTTHESRDRFLGRSWKGLREAAPNDTTWYKTTHSTSQNKLPPNMKRDADMFEAYVAAVFLTNGSDFNLVHEWLCPLWKPFHDQACRFMLRRSETIALLNASSQDVSARGQDIPSGSTWAPALSIPGALQRPKADAVAALIDMTRLYPNFSDASELRKMYTLNSTDHLSADDCLTKAARARRDRDERIRQEVRNQRQKELMNMGWFQKGYMNLQKGFRQYIMGQDAIEEEEATLRLRAQEEKERRRHELRRFGSKGR